MQLILGHLRPDFGEFVNLMTQRLAVVADQSSLAAATLARPPWHHIVTLFGRYQRAFVFTMPWLTATLPLRLLLLSRWPGVRMLCARRLRGVLRRFAQPRLQLGQSLQQQANNGLCFRRLPRNQIFRDLQRHASVVAENRFRGNLNSQKTSHRPVTGYIPVGANSAAITTDVIRRPVQ